MNHFLLWLNKPRFSSHQTHTNTHNHLLCPCLHPTITVLKSLIYWTASPHTITIPQSSLQALTVNRSKQPLLETLNKSNRNVQTIQNKPICDPGAQNQWLSHWGIFVAIAKNTLYGSKIMIFFYAKIIRILSKDHVPRRYFVNFLL